MENHSEFVFYRTYARWLEDKGRRETFSEAVDRYISFLREISVDKNVPEKVFKKIHKHMTNLSVVGSMRLFWSAGDAARANNLTAYNCSFISVHYPDAFSELTYILMCGTGVGLSVEKEYTSQLPVISTLNPFQNQSQPVVIKDSREGWADSIKILVNSLYKGVDVHFDYSKLRPKGAILKTMGGRSSGPEPLVIAHHFIKDIFSKAQGRQLTDLEIMDICCQIAETVVVGGVRRSSLIILSDIDSQAMSTAKTGNIPSRRYNANISWVAHTKPSFIEFLTEWTNLIKSNSGERGISNLGAMRLKDESRVIKGFNPCHEIALDNNELCNLSEIIVRPDDTIEDLLDKVETATWIGLLQSTLTNFKYVNSKWKENCEENRLLGVSLSGQADNPTVLTKENLQLLRKKAHKIAAHGSKILGINKPKAITTGKPSGSVSQLANCGSGCHSWYAKHYIRRYRISSNDPLCKLLQSEGYNLIPEVGQEDQVDPNTYIIEFPVKAPEGARLRGETAIQQLEWYNHIQDNWCDHNQSCTIYVKEDEWLAVGDYIYRNWDRVIGCSFLPYDGGQYKLAPYEEISEKVYNERIALEKAIPYHLLSKFETEDNTEGSKTYACVGDRCELK